MIFWMLWLAMSSLLVVDPAAANEQLFRGEGDGGGVPGLSAGVGDESTQAYLENLQGIECAPKLPAVYDFDPILGNDTTGNGSPSAPFRSGDKAVSVCSAPGTWCRVKSGSAWGKRFDLTSPSGALTKGEIVTFTEGSATLLDYDAAEGVGIFENRLHPQSIHTTEVTSGNITITHNGATTGNIAFDASAATVDTALEALSNITTVTVTGAGTSGDPWVITFVDPPMPNERLAATNVDLSSGDVVVTVPDLTDSTVITGETSGSTATTASGEDLAPTTLLDFSTASCDAGELCMRLSPTVPGERFTISFDSEVKGAADHIFGVSADGCAVVEGVNIRRPAEPTFEVDTSGCLYVVNYDVWEAVDLGSVIPGVLEVSDSALIWSLNGSGTANGRHSSGGGFISGDILRAEGGHIYAIGSGVFGRGLGQPKTELPGNIAPIVAIVLSDGSQTIIGHHLDASRLANAAATGIARVFELALGSNDTLTLWDTLSSGAGNSLAVGLGVTGTHADGTSRIVLVGTTWADLGRPFVLGNSNPFTLSADSLLMDDLAAGGAYIRTAHADAASSTTLTIEGFVHDDDGQTSDWDLNGTTFDTLAALLADPDTSNWSVTGSVDGTSPQWSQDYQCDASKECWRSYVGSNTLVFDDSIRPWVTNACREITALTKTNGNIGAR